MNNKSTIVEGNFVQYKGVCGEYDIVQVTEIEIINNNQRLYSFETPDGVQMGGYDDNVVPLKLSSKYMKKLNFTEHIEYVSPHKGLYILIYKNNLVSLDILSIGGVEPFYVGDSQMVEDFLLGRRYAGMVSFDVSPHENYRFSQMNIDFLLKKDEKNSFIKLPTVHELQNYCLEQNIRGIDFLRFFNA